MGDGMKFLCVSQCLHFPGEKFLDNLPFRIILSPRGKSIFQLRIFVVVATRVVELFLNYVTQREVGMELTQGLRPRRFPSLKVKWI